jgi:hypothetical protein
MRNVRLSPEAESYFAKKGGSVAADSRGYPCLQQVTCKEDRTFSRDLLKRLMPAEAFVEERQCEFSEFAWHFCLCDAGV